MNFEDLLDVSNDTFFNLDALIKEMINAKTVFTWIFDALQKNEKESCISQLQAASKAL